MSEVENALLAELQASKQRAEELGALLESERRRAAEAEQQLRFSRKPSQVKRSHRRQTLLCIGGGLPRRRVDPL